MPSIGWQELIIVLVIVLIVMGPKRLPDMGRSLGRSIKEFKQSSSSEIEEAKAAPDSRGQKVEAAESAAATDGH